VNRHCERCRYRIDVIDVLKQDSSKKIICPNCGRYLVATTISRALVMSVFIMFFLVFLLLPINFVYIILVEIIWSYIAQKILPAFLNDYEEIKEDVE